MSQNGDSNLNQDVSNITKDDSEPNLLTLPDVPLLLILKNVPLYSLITDHQLVHLRFATFCKIALKQNHRLLLYIGHLKSIQKFKCSFRIGIPFANYLVDANGMYRSYEPEFYRLHYLTLNSKTVDQLVTLMPAISHLEVVISQVNKYLISRLIRLLTHWASTLKWFKFCCGEFQPEESKPLHKLIRQINCKLSVLEHLTLDLDGELMLIHKVNRRTGWFVEEDPKLDLPILAQLKEFFIQTNDQESNLRTLLNTVERQADAQLTAIGLAFPFVLDYFKKFVNHPLAARLKLLSTRDEPPDEHTLFPTLTGYTVNWYNQPLNSVTRRLSSLKHLQYLELHCKKHTFMRRSSTNLSISQSLRNRINTIIRANEAAMGCGRFCRMIELNPIFQNILLAQNESLSVDPVNLSPLPSVEILRINVNSCATDHTVLQDAHWATLFPSVQIVNLIHMGEFCAKCYQNDEYNSRNPPGFEQIRERIVCFAHLLAPLTVLPSLRKIFYQRNNDLKNIAEFTGKGEFVKTHAYIY